MSSNSNHAHPLLIVVSAPSGGGKTTLCQQLLAARPTMTRAITCTTRAPRAGERDGVDYRFLDMATFRKRVESGDFVEHATVFGNHYGTLKADLSEGLRAGKDVLLAVDVQGAATLRSRTGEDAELRRALVTIFLTPPSLKILEERLRRRATDAPEVIENRLGMARQEFAQWPHFDYLVISRSVEEDLRRALAIVDAEKMRSVRAQPPEL
jgi:guanylate kinase